VQYRYLPASAASCAISAEEIARPPQAVLLPRSNRPTLPDPPVVRGNASETQKSQDSAQQCPTRGHSPRGNQPNSGRFSPWRAFIYITFSCPLDMVDGRATFFIFEGLRTPAILLLLLVYDFVFIHDARRRQADEKSGVYGYCLT
jgi:hypothetical protein